MSERIQRKRTKGWRMPEGAIYVGRTNAEHDIWGNPFRIGEYYRRGDSDRSARFRMTYMHAIIWTEDDIERAVSSGYTLIQSAEQAVEWFRWYVGTWGDNQRANCMAELRGKSLACWCPIISQGKYCPCHADVLLSIANDIPMDEVIRENIRRAKG